MLFLVPVVLFVGGMAAKVIGQQAGAGTLALAGLGMKAAQAVKGYPSGESQFTDRYHPGGIRVTRDSESDLGRQLAEAALLESRLQQYCGKTLNLTNSEGRLCRRLLNDCIRVHETVLDLAQDQRRLLDKARSLAGQLQPGDPSVARFEKKYEKLDLLRNRNLVARQEAFATLCAYLEEKQVRIS